MLRNRLFLTFFTGIVLVAVAFIFYGVCIEPSHVEINHVLLRNDSLNTVFKNKVVVQISDLHIDKIGKREKEVLRILDELQPDILFLTGDYVQWNGDYKASLSFLSQLKANIGFWAVMGDYDYSNSRKSCLFCHEEGSGKPSQLHSVHFLRDKVETVALPNGMLWIGGIDMHEDRISFQNMDLAFLRNKKPLIILSHSPLNFDLLDKDQEVLMLSGDTHGGQIPLPSWIFRVLGYEKSSRYSQGIFERGNNKMYVSRGIGTSHLPIRLFRQPEVVVFHFQ